MRGARCVDSVSVAQLTDGEIVLPRNYAYWQNINAHRNMPNMLVFVGTDRGPFLYSINKISLDVRPLGPLFDEGHFLQNSTAEGFYWSAFDPYMLYCNDDDYLYRWHIDSKSIHPIAYAGDVVDDLGMSTPIALRQWHSSFDENVHSASVLEVTAEGSWPKITTIVYHENLHRYTQYPAQGVLDESQVDKSGNWLLIKEDDDHRLVNLVTSSTVTMADEDGAVGHSDNGFNYAVGADNWGQLAQWRLHNFVDGTSRVIYECPWDAQVLHVSHCNAQLLLPERQFVLGSGTCPSLMKIYLDGVTPAVEVAPSMTVGSDYDSLPKASLDPYGTFAFWIRFDGSRYDAFITRVP